jgi:hypothetical protein
MFCVYAIEVNGIPPCILCEGSYAAAAMVRYADNNFDLRVKAGTELLATDLQCMQISLRSKAKTHKPAKWACAVGRRNGKVQVLTV